MPSSTATAEPATRRVPVAFASILEALDNIEPAPSSLSSIVAAVAFPNVRMCIVDPTPPLRARVGSSEGVANV
jgi:hypothetical protein